MGKIITRSESTRFRRRRANWNCGRYQKIEPTLTSEVSKWGKVLLKYSKASDQNRTIFPCNCEAEFRRFHGKRSAHLQWDQRSFESHVHLKISKDKTMSSFSYFLIFSLFILRRHFRLIQLLYSRSGKPRLLQWDKQGITFSVNQNAKVYTAIKSICLKLQI